MLHSDCPLCSGHFVLILWCEKSIPMQNGNQDLSDTTRQTKFLCRFPQNAYGVIVVVVHTSVTYKKLVYH